MSIGIAVSVRLKEDVYKKACRKADGAGLTFQSYVRQLLAHDLHLLGTESEEEPKLGPIARPPKGGDR